MAKLRHIAYRADDVEAMANFFVNSFDMTIAQRRKNGAIDLSDGTINIDGSGLRNPNNESFGRFNNVLPSRQIQYRFRLIF